MMRQKSTKIKEKIRKNQGGRLTHTPPTGTATEGSSSKPRPGNHSILYAVMMKNDASKIYEIHGGKWLLRYNKFTFTYIFNVSKSNVFLKIF